MTRLDATSEPSMEDILASIRKIIAEDPPGSRAALAPAETLDRAVMPTPQPYAAPDVSALETNRGGDLHRPSPAAIDADAFFAKPAAKALTSDAPLARVEPSFAPMTQSYSMPQAPSAALSVEAQLSDLLGDALPAPSAMSALSKSALPDTAATVSTSYADQTAARGAASMATVAAAPVDDARQDVFQDARNGADVSFDKSVSGQVPLETDVESDPFDFDLGPSPFEPKLESKPLAAPVFPALSAAPSQPLVGGQFTAFDLGGFVPVRSAEAPIALSPAPPSPEPVVATPQPAAPVNGLMVPPQKDGAALAEPATAISAVDKPAIDGAAPSVAATIAPEVAASSRPAEPVARFVPANASVETPKPIERDVLEVVSPSRAVEVRASTETFERDSLSEMMAVSASVPTHHAGGPPRTMEDTVAELLRPMLRTWLAENMPRIVERALRRELTDQLAGDKQEAAE